MERFKSLPYWQHLAIDAIITQAIWWVGATVMATPILVRSIIAGIVLLATMFLVAWYLPKWGRKSVATATSNISFYRTRQELTTSRGSMAQELGDAHVKKTWVAWWTGASARANRLYEPTNLKRSPPIDRMILIDPNGKYIESHANIEGRTVGEIRQDILHTVEMFSKAGVALRFFDGYIEGMVIADTVKYANENEFSDDAWIRIEPCLPYKDIVNACNYVVYKKYDRKLFDALIDSYLFLWEKSIQQNKSETV